MSDSENGLRRWVDKALIGSCALIITMVLGFYGSTVADIADVRARVERIGESQQSLSERVTRLETLQEAVLQRLIRIEEKMDRELQRREPR